MSKEIEAFDMAIEKLQEAKRKAIIAAQAEEKEEEKAANTKITSQDKKIIKELCKKAKWWAEKGKPVERAITIKIKANLLWTEDKHPCVDGYDLSYNNKSIDFDELIRWELFEDELDKAKQEIDELCEQVEVLEKKYPYANINGQIF